MKLTLTTRGRNPQVFEVTNESADEHRLAQLLGQWMPAATVCCYLGIANPLGAGSAAELAEVRLDQTINSTDDTETVIVDLEPANPLNGRDDDGDFLVARYFRGERHGEVAALFPISQAPVEPVDDRGLAELLFDVTEIQGVERDADGDLIVALFIY